MVGRIKEISELTRLYESTESEFVAVYGRRRVGKTYLVRETFADHFAFHHTGLPNAVKRQQINHFRKSLMTAGYEGPAFANWFEDFEALGRIVSRALTHRKIFIDELPWMDTAKSDFIMAFEWASAFDFLKRLLRTSISGSRQLPLPPRPSGEALPSSGCVCCIFGKYGRRLASMLFMSRPTDGVSGVMTPIPTACRLTLC